MSNNIYNILGKLADLTPKEEPKQQATKIYESVEARGSVLEGVKGVEKKLSEQFELMKEQELDEKAAPGQEEWIKKNKKHFIDQYGKKKGLEVLYATAWKRSKADESIEEGTGDWDDPDDKQPKIRKIVGKYGTEYQGDPDEDDEEQRKVDTGTRKRGRPRKHAVKEPKTGANGEKLGRGRPKKAGSTFSAPKLFGMGTAPKKHPKGKVHRMNESTINEGCTLDEGGVTFQHILDTYKRDVNDVKAGGDMSEDLYNALYDYYFDDMPYGTKKARTGDPYEWVYQRFCDDLGIDEAAPMAAPAAPCATDNAIGLDSDLNELAKLAGLNVAEGKKADRDYDGDGEIESPEDEYKGSKDKAIKQATKVEENCDGSISPLGAAVQEMGNDKLNISTNYDSVEDKTSVTVTAEGEQAEALLQLLKMAGLGGGQTAQQAQAVVVAQEAKEYGDTDVEEAPEYANSPDEEVEDVDAIIHQGDDLNKEKKQFADKPKTGDNPMATKESFNPLEALGNRLMAAYESIKVKK